jgi:hypothetical protein
MLVPLMITIPTTDVQHKIIHKRFSPNFFLKNHHLYLSKLLKIELHWNFIINLHGTRKVYFYIPIPLLLKFWKIKIKTIRPRFLK